MDPFDDAALFGAFDGKKQKRSREDEDGGSQKRAKDSKEYFINFCEASLVFILFTIVSFKN
jgi:hypothetical protein